MSISFNLLYGNSVSKNSPDNKQGNRPLVRLTGTFKGAKSSFPMGLDELSKHVLLMGGTGCGKTTLFYHFVDQIRKSMTKDDVMIIFDSKGDFFSKFKEQDDFVVGNSKQYMGISQKWNVFKEIVADGFEDERIILNTREICKSFFEEKIKKSNDPFFPSAGCDILSCIIISMLRSAKAIPECREILYNSELKTWINMASPEKIITSIFEDEDNLDLSAFQAYIAGGTDQSLGVMSEMLSVINDIFVGVFSGKGVFSIRNFVRNKGKKVLFIEYDLSMGNILTPIYRLMFDLALKEALGRNSSQGNVYLICDEFKLLPNLQHIDDGVNFGRSLGVKIIAGIQSIEQLFEIYGKSRGMNIAAGFSSLFAFRSNDVSSREYVSNLYGKNIILEQYQKANMEIVEDKRTGNTVEDWDMNTLQIGEAIVGLPFSQPFRFYFDKY